MDRQEKVWWILDALELRYARPVGEGDERIPIPGEHDLIAGLPAQLFCQPSRNSQRDILFLRAAYPDGTRISSAVTGIDHHQP